MAHELDQAALLQLIARGTEAQSQTMRAVQGMVDTMRPLIENLQEERHEQRATTQQLIAESQQTREELRQSRALQAKLLEALQVGPRPQPRRCKRRPACNCGSTDSGAGGCGPASVRFRLPGVVPGCHHAQLSVAGVRAACMPL